MSTSYEPPHMNRHIAMWTTRGPVWAYISSCSVSKGMYASIDTAWEAKEKRFSWVMPTHYASLVGNWALTVDDKYEYLV